MTNISIPQLDPEAAARRLDAGAVLLDVREDDEWRAGHAPGAVHIKMNDVPARVSEVPGGDVVVICRAGGRSQKVAEFLAGQGTPVANLAGGMQAWAASGRPVVTDDSNPGQVI